MDPRLVGGRRTRAPGERPREYNDPSKQDQDGGAYYHKTRTQRVMELLGAVLLLAIAAGILGGIGFIIFNLVF